MVSWLFTHTHAHIFHCSRYRSFEPDRDRIGRIRREKASSAHVLTFWDPKEDEWEYRLNECRSTSSEIRNSSAAFSAIGIRHPQMRAICDFQRIRENPREGVRINAESLNFTISGLAHQKRGIKGHARVGRIGEK